MCQLADALQQQTVTMILFICLYLFCNLFIQTLMTLDVRENQISDNGAKHLGNMLQNNQVC
jgi:amino acid permease